MIHHPSLSPEELVEQIADAYTGGLVLDTTSEVLARRHMQELKNRALPPGNKIICSPFMHTIYPDPSRVSGKTLDYGVLHEIMHMELSIQFPGHHDERIVHRGTRAMMLARAPFSEGVQRIGLDIPALVRAYPGPPPDVVARRVADVRRSLVVSICECGRVLDRVASSDVDPAQAEAAAAWAEDETGSVALGGKTPRTATSDLGHAMGWRLSPRAPSVGVVVCQLFRTPILSAWRCGEVVYDEGLAPLGYEGSRLL